MAIAADKYGTSYGMKDRWGRRYEHYGFFDDKHKHVGKTLAEVLAMEFEERRTKDDDYELLLKNLKFEAAALEPLMLYR